MHSCACKNSTTLNATVSCLLTVPFRYQAMDNRFCWRCWRPLKQYQPASQRFCALEGLSADIFRDLKNRNTRYITCHQIGVQTSTWMYFMALCMPLQLTTGSDGSMQNLNVPLRYHLRGYWVIPSIIGVEIIVQGSWHTQTNGTLQEEVVLKEASFQ